MKLWIARDYKCDYNKKPCLTIFYDKPYINDNDWWHWKTYGKFKVINENLFSEVTYENSPQQVEIKLIEDLIIKE